MERENLIIPGQVHHREMGEMGFPENHSGTINLSPGGIGKYYFSIFFSYYVF